MHKLSNLLCILCVRNTATDLELVMLQPFIYIERISCPPNKHIVSMIGPWSYGDWTSGLLNDE